MTEGAGGLDPLPDLPLSAHPNYVTPQGLVALKLRLQARQAELAGALPGAAVGNAVTWRNLPPARWN